MASKLCSVTRHVRCIALHAMWTSLAKVVLLSSLVVSNLASCTDDGLGEDGAADIQGDEEKADGLPGIEVTARVTPGSVDATLSTKVPRRGYVFYAAEGTQVTVEVTQAGTNSGLDTVVKIYGPRLADGTYPKTIASDEDSGYGKLSKAGAQITIPGFYLAEVSFGAAAVAADERRARVKLSCDGTCESSLPVDTDLGLKWYRRSAERRALAAQAYRVATEKVAAKKAAGITGAWGVVLDIDETTLNNSQYQHERMELGLGFSPASWTEWVNRKAATPLDGVVDFTKKVKSLGGKVVFVSNRMQATECEATAANLDTAGIPRDGMLCKTDTSDKNVRFAAITAGTAPSTLPPMKTIIYLGDNIQDFPMLTQDVRKQAASAFDKFGDEFILLPNSMYGSWEKNLDDNSL